MLLSDLLADGRTSEMVRARVKGFRNRIGQPDNVGAIERLGVGGWGLGIGALGIGDVRRGKCRVVIYPPPDPDTVGTDPDGPADWPMST